MPQNDIATWLKFALQQMAAENYLDNIDLNSLEDVTRRLLLGNNREGFSEAALLASRERSRKDKPTILPSDIKSSTIMPTMPRGFRRRCFPMWKTA